MEKGSQYLEYTLAVAFIMIVFIAAGVYLRDASNRRANSSMNMHNTMIPCETGLSGEACL